MFSLVSVYPQGACVVKGACMAGGLHVWGHAWQGACVVGGVHSRGECVAGGSVRWPLQRTVRILLECIPVN